MEGLNGNMYSMLRCSTDKLWSDEPLSDVISHSAAKRFKGMHKTGSTMGVTGVEIK